MGAGVNEQPVGWGLTPDERRRRQGPALTCQLRGAVSADARARRLRRQTLSRHVTLRGRASRAATRPQSTPTVSCGVDRVVSAGVVVSSAGYRGPRTARGHHCCSSVLRSADYADAAPVAVLWQQAYGVAGEMLEGNWPPAVAVIRGVKNYGGLLCVGSRCLRPRVKNDKRSLIIVQGLWMI